LTQPPGSRSWQRPVAARFAAPVALFTTLFTALLLSQSPFLTVLSRDARRSLALTLVNEQEFVALDEVAAMFQLSVREDALGALTVSYKDKTIVLMPDQPLASVAGRLVSLPAAVRRGPAPGRRWLVPVEFISRAVAPIYDTRLELRKPSRLLIVGDLRVPRVTARYETVGANGRLTIDATPRANSTVAQENDRLLIKFDADALDVTNPLLQPPPQALVQSVRAVDPLTLAIDLTPRFAAFKATTQPLDTVNRVVIDLLPAQTEAAGQPPSAPAAPPAAPAPPPPDLGVNQVASSVRTIAIDPGHGGEDDGVKGESGVKEKDLALAVARRAKGLIEARLGIRVLLTRDDDRNVPLDERTSIANSNKADLFISLHANASWRRSLGGAVIFSAAFPNDAEQAVRGAANPEPLPTFGGGVRNIELVPWNLAQLPHIDRASELARILEEQLRNRIPLAARSVDAAPLRVLESANMPAVLVEMGYLTNAQQEKQLVSPEFQTTFAQAVYDAVVKFRDTLDAGRRPPVGGAP